jgi:hypothetical protein
MLARNGQYAPRVWAYARAQHHMGHPQAWSESELACELADLPV